MSKISEAVSSSIGFRRRRNHLNLGPIDFDAVPVDVVPVFSDPRQPTSRRDPATSRLPRSCALASVLLASSSADSPNSGECPGHAEHLDAVGGVANVGVADRRAGNFVELAKAKLKLIAAAVSPAVARRSGRALLLRMRTIVPLRRAEGPRQDHAEASVARVGRILVTVEKDFPCKRIGLIRWDRPQTTGSDPAVPGANRSSVRSPCPPHRPTRSSSRASASCGRYRARPRCRGAGESSKHPRRCLGAS